MDEDDTEDLREAVTLVNQLSTKVTTSTSKFTSKISQHILRAQESDSDTMECASENEVENLPKDEDTSQSVKTRKLYEKCRYSLDIPDDAESLRKKTTVSSLRVSDSSRLGLFMVTNRSPQSSSSQEEYEPEVKSISRLQQRQQQQHLLTAGGVSSQVTARSMESLRSSKNFLSADDRYIEDSKSMESLSSSSETHVGSSKTHYRSFLTSSTRDVRRIVTVESKSSENLHREESMNAEVRRGLFANTGLERKIPQHLSLPPPTNVFSLTSPGGSDRKITILSPHSPLQTLQTSEFQFTTQTLKSRRKKAIVLPRLVLPRSDSEVFLE
ncbi:hypothetical protein ALC62_15558 [Cyphomyrmex costatus]|uniref:Uncharacterized protein n=1 Tax=Cyphomyrmex costatus TaxID=456900 RepID=A0A195C108_9HYME|nr:hypothetical protein ALC62_15558 [Cyphomyrmex costatus]